jgi:TetR/AcrR family transcriptional repressor of nem operon
MPRDATATRERIVEAATRSTLHRGFSATSIEQVVQDAGVTKGAFFHHFASKADLGRAILDRYAAEDLETLERTWSRAESLARDPLGQLLLFVGLVADLDSPGYGDPGCVYASYLYERQLGIDGAEQVIERAVLAWRARFRAKLDEVVRTHPPRLPIDEDALSDLLFSTSEGAYVVARATRSPDLVRRQILQLRNYLELLFESPPAPAHPA